MGQDLHFSTNSIGTISDAMWYQNLPKKFTKVKKYSKLWLQQKQ